MSVSPDPAALSEATEDLNVALLEAESALRDLGLAVTAEVSLDDGRELQFRKQSNMFQLVVETNGERHLLINLSRETRVRAAEKLPSLRDALLVAYKREVERVRAAAVAVTSFAEEIRSDVPRCP